MSFVIGVFAIVVFLAALSAFSIREGWLGLVLMMVGSILTWWIIGANRDDNPVHIYSLRPAYMVGNSVCTSHEGRIINLNSATGTNFNPGDFVVIDTIEGRWVYGIYFCEEETIKHWRESNPSPVQGTIQISPPQNQPATEKDPTLNDT
jgi:hypothetical protein